ncbi:hypothetical protein SAMN02746065_103122 [Desulfocicer vacuolatum DSM 3385]|uniref:SHOCT domain-containing protein n=1 Tax=Desulfocicer vacuolatum DSM 3385 TaxID=1121400 RepID=A0A1W1ZR34_9BACT|nr:SHOCT domain-containing protein [Desulfocicer vacuolatum]SMC51000.1 hypothetical protein SAMN02746065_103122 [Desulfocicer vacuolatum DSM 3385]
MKNKKRDQEGIFKSLFAAYFVLLLHVFLLAGTGITVVLFRGVYHYLPWIMAGLAVLIIALFWIFYLRMKKNTREIKEILAFPQFQGRNVEIKLLGGMASVKIDGGTPSASNVMALEQPLNSRGEAVPLLASAQESPDKRLSDLAQLYLSDLITREEFDLAKEQIFSGNHTGDLADALESINMDNMPGENRQPDKSNRGEMG